MKIEVIKIAGGAMLPANEESEQALQKVENGKHYTVDIRLNHNYKLLQKIHVFFKYCAQYYFGDENVDLRQIKLTRDKITMSAGYVEQVFLPGGKRFVLYPQSISYAKMTPEERAECYSRLVNAALKNVFHSADESEFNKLMSFF